MEKRRNEIICISSDDDEDMRQNKADIIQTTVIKQSEDNCVTNLNVELSSNNIKKVELSGRKRKAPRIDSDDDDSVSASSAKVFVRDEGNSIKAIRRRESVEKDEEKETDKAEQEEDKILLKPKLVVKEKKAISPVEQDIFPMFISLCLQKDRSEDMKAIVNKLKRRYEQLKPEYINSEAFINFLNEKRNDIMHSKNKLYIYISEVMNEMKNSIKGKSNLLLNGNDSGINKNSNSSIPAATCSSISHVGNNMAIDSEITSTNANDEKELEKQVAIQRKLNIIIKTMNKCEKHIKKLEESEVDFDSENNSNYIKLEKYKHRMVELYNSYCEYSGQNADAERQYLRPKHFSTTGIVAVDHAITSFINSKIYKRRKLKKIGAFTNALIFPDYSDILKCVKKCNDSHNLGLDNKKQQQLAKKAFTDLGEYLQRCRRNDYWDTFSLFLENKEDDPALKDPMLAEKLTQNKKLGEKRLSNVFQKYVEKQEEIKDQATDSKSVSEHEENEDDSGENDNEDDNEVDTISEVDINLSMDKENSSLDEDEDSADRSETFGNKINTEEGTHDINAIEIEKEQQTETSDRLKSNDVDRAKSEVDNNISSSKSNTESESTKRNNAPPLLPHLARKLCTLSEVTLAVTTNNEITNNKTEEEEKKVKEERVVKGEEEEKVVKGEEEEKEEEEGKPLLRVRSFAKPPTTWEDVQEKVVEYNKDESVSKTSIEEVVIDLTEDSPKENFTVHQCGSIQIGSKVLPIMKGNYKTVVVPATKSIINVKNITNNYVRLNSKNVDSTKPVRLESGQIVSPQYVIGKSSKSRTTIHLPTNSPTNQQTKQKSTIVQIPHSNQIVVLPTKQKENTSQRPKTKTNLSTSSSK
ncbi:daxx-like protein [Xylocopa sonorina]|uniref:daxx-like protein n=1 Tax=Xylocopa sonorina TaxID=1818115 RepID=UPI00403AC808